LQAFGQGVNRSWLVAGGFITSLNPEFIHLSIVTSVTKGKDRGKFYA
jgi:hypothetical protein